MSFRFCAFAAASILAITMVPAGARNLVKNGSFETPVVQDGSYQTFNTGDTFKGWTAVGASGNVAIVSQDFTYCAHTFPAKRGVQFVDLTGTSDTATGLQQTVKTTPGATYTLSFYIGNVYDTSSNCGTSSTVNVMIDGVQIASFTNTGGRNGTTIVWKKYSTQFVAQNATTAVGLINGDPPQDTANGLDAVSLSLTAGAR